VIFRYSRHVSATIHKSIDDAISGSAPSTHQSHHQAAPRINDTDNAKSPEAKAGIARTIHIRSSHDTTSKENRQRAIAQSYTLPVGRSASWRLRGAWHLRPATGQRACSGPGRTAVAALVEPIALRNDLQDTVSASRQRLPYTIGMVRIPQRGPHPVWQAPRGS